MTLLTLATAKAHLRADSDDEDALIQLWLTAAEVAAMEYLNRNVYVDGTALTAAKAAVAGSLSAATSAYDAAVQAANLLPSLVERNIALHSAEQAYLAAQNSARETYNGIVINDLISAAILLIVGHLYENRQEAQPGTVTQIPMGAHHLLQPFRVDMGV